MVRHRSDLGWRTPAGLLAARSPDSPGVAGPEPYRDTVTWHFDDKGRGWMQPGDARIVRGAVLATTAVGVVVVAVAGLLAGWSGAIGALLGTGLAMAFFAVTIVVVSVAARIANELMLPAALGTYLLKIIGIGLALLLLRDTTAFDRTAFALATVIGACAFLVAELRIALRSRTLYVNTTDRERAPGSPRTG